MSKRSGKGRRPPPSTAFTDLFGPLDGAQIPGGCEHCDAYQTVTPIESGAWKMTVHHDDWCPWWTARRASR